MNRRYLFIVGAQKAGTSTLYQVLSRHPAVNFSKPKEPHYFSTHLRVETGYTSLFPNANPDAWYADGSVSYLHIRQVATRLQQFVRDHPAKIVIAVRDPVDRAVSAYNHLVKTAPTPEHRDVGQIIPPRGVQTSDDIVAWEREQLDLAVKSGYVTAGTFSEFTDDPLWPFRYWANSRYGNQAAQYVAAFGASNIHIVRLEKLAQDWSGELTRLFQFLSIEASPHAIGEPVSANVTRLARGNILGALWRFGPLRRTMRHTLHSLRADRLKVRLRNASSRAPTNGLASDVKSRIERAFADDVARLREVFPEQDLESR